MITLGRNACRTFLLIYFSTFRVSEAHCLSQSSRILSLRSCNHQIDQLSISTDDVIHGLYSCSRFHPSLLYSLQNSRERQLSRFVNAGRVEACLMQNLCRLQLHLLHNRCEGRCNGQILVEAFVNGTGTSSYEVEPITGDLENSAW